MENPQRIAVFREVKEETGYDVNILDFILTKKTVINGIDVTTDYYEVNVIGGKMTVNDPDQTIIEVGWKSFEELQTLQHMYPEDIEYIKNILEKDKVTT
ncbi:NUDIX domain-containing protein [Cytobacillus sp. Hm23]